MIVVKPLQDHVPKEDKGEDEEGAGESEQPDGDGQQRVLFHKGFDTRRERHPQQASIRR